MTYGNITFDTALYFQRTFLIKHYLDEHRNAHSQFSCDQCDRKFFRKANLVLHQVIFIYFIFQSFHILVLNQDLSVSQCKIMKFSKEKVHTVSSTVCDFCSQTYPTKSLHLHIKNTHEKVFCLVCKAIFVGRQSLRDHVKKTKCRTRYKYLQIIR